MLERINNSYDIMSFTHGTRNEIEENKDLMLPYEPAIAVDTNEFLFKDEQGNLVGAVTANVIDTVEDLKASKAYKLGDVVEVLGFHAKGDGSHHKRKITDNPTKPYITLNNGLKAELLEKTIRPEWLGTRNIHEVLFKHIAVLSDTSNYTILLKKEEYTCINPLTGSSSDFNTFDGLSILGSGMPYPIPDKSKLVCGTIIHGSIKNRGDFFKIKDLGIDLGKEWCDSTGYVGWFGQKGDECVILGEKIWDGVHIKSPYAENICTLNYDINSQYHGFLVEKTIGAYCKNIQTHGSFHGFVIKSGDITVENVECYGGAYNAFIIKSHHYDLQNIKIRNVKINPFKKFEKDGTIGLRIHIADNYSISDVEITNMDIKNCTKSVVFEKQAEATCSLFEFNNLTIRDCDGHFDSLYNMTNNLYTNFNNLQLINSGIFVPPKIGMKNINGFKYYDNGTTTDADAYIVVTDTTYMTNIDVQGTRAYSLFKYDDSYKNGNFVNVNSTNKTVNCNNNAFVKVQDKELSYVNYIQPVFNDSNVITEASPRNINSRVVKDEIEIDFSVMVVNDTSRLIYKNDLCPVDIKTNTTQVFCNTTNSFINCYWNGTELKKYDTSNFIKGETYKISINLHCVDVR